ncbi:MAG: Na+/H+ antiporter NhaA [Deltaproteobacteria bacterium]|nr:Na+/H+ antiporter NhaA [Deltaproteobacteria bacterium]
MKKSINLLREFSLPLILGVVLAVVWANVDSHGYHEALHWSPFGAHSELTLHFFFNDIFMVFFFGIAAKEITESCLPGGALNPPRKAVNPLLATVGGVLGPIAVYFAWTAISGDHAIARGWGVPTATDIALAWLVARLVFGKGHPAVAFLLLLAVADDGIGLGIIAIFYPDPSHPVEPAWLLAVAGAMAMAWGMRKRGITSWIPYVTVAGGVSWYALYSAHLHPALALVAIVPFMPHAAKDEGLFEEDAGHAHNDTLSRFEHAFKLPVDLGLFGFGLMNAGVELGAVGDATWGVMFALIIGKTLGVTGFALVGDKLGFKLPEGMKPKTVVATGMVAALGLTVALFVAGVAFTDPTLQAAAKMGALGSVAAVPLVVGYAVLFRVGRFAKTTAQVKKAVTGAFQRPVQAVEAAARPITGAFPRPGREG